jgi:hypothetical protein
MRHYFLFSFVFCFSIHSFAQSVLSDSARISLMTVAPGNEVYSLFGHSAIRVFDEGKRLNRCYNYGTFEFDQPNFLVKFCRGKLLYYLNPESYRAFENANMQDGRPMQEQVLNLNPEQKQRLYQLLEENAKEANRYYKYDFFYDNCSTRIREIIKETFYHQIYYDSTGLTKGATMRDLLFPYVEYHPWTRFGIDLVLGQPCDKKATAEDYMFLPDHLHDFIGKTKITGITPLVKSEKNIPEDSANFRRLQSINNDPIDLFFANPLWVMCFVALLGFLSMANPRTERVFDTIFWLVLGIAGLIMTLLWFATDHSATKQNWNILWALPTHLLFFWRSTKNETTQNYFVGTAILAALALAFWKFCPQAMPIAAIPIAILVIVKGLWRGTFNK